MINQEELRDLLAELESYRIERTTSTKDTDKFSQAKRISRAKSFDSFPVFDAAIKDRIEIQSPGGLFGEDVTHQIIFFVN